MKSIAKSFKRVGADGVLGKVRRRRPKPTQASTGRQIIAMTDDDPVLVPLLQGRYPQEPFRHGEYVHVSDLLYRCIRKIALSELLNEDIHAETIWPGRALTFRFGHATEDHVREELKKNAPKMLWGDWQCPCEHTLVKGRTWHQVRDAKCPKCGHPPISYKERVIRDDEFMITSAVDILLLMDGYFYLNECKSMARKMWEELKRPMPEHLIQVLMYWHLYRRAGYKLWDRVSLIYVNKEFMFSGLPYKEFHFQPSVLSDRLDELFQEAAELTAFRREGMVTLPRRRMCTDQQSTEAKRCQFRHVCFEMEG